MTYSLLSMTTLYKKFSAFGGRIDIIESTCVMGSSFTSARLHCCRSGVGNSTLDGIMLIRAADLVKKISQPT